MPIMNSFGALKQQHYSVASVPTPQTYWMALTSLKVTSPVSTGSNRVISKFINNSIWEFGNEYSVAGSQTYRPYVIGFNDTTGAVNYYKVFADQTFSTSSTNLTEVRGLEIDGSLNKHIIGKNSSSSITYLLKYDSSDVFQTGLALTGSGTFGSLLGSVKDSSNYIYLMNNAGSSVIVTKIDPSSYSILWSKQVTITTNDGGIFIDSADNIFINIWNSTSTTNTVIKFDTSGTVAWQKEWVGWQDSLKTCFSFDSSNNIYIMNTTNPPFTLVKLDSNFNVLYAKSISNSSLSYRYKGLVVTDTNILIWQEGPAGAFYWTFTSAISLDGTTVYNNNRIGNGSATVDYINIVNTGANRVYYKGYSTNGANPVYITKLPPKNDVAYTKAYSFPVTNDAGTVITTSGTFDVTALGSIVSIASTSMSFSIASYTVSDFSISTSSYTPTLGTTIPASFNASL